MVNKVDTVNKEVMANKVVMVNNKVVMVVNKVTINNNHNQFMFNNNLKRKIVDVVVLVVRSCVVLVS